MTNTSALSHLAVYPAMYTLGVYLLTVLAIGTPIPEWHPFVFILLTGHSCYLLDRVKVTDARQDPADAIALPQRALLFTKHAGILRALLTIELLIASIVGYQIEPLLAWIPLGALVGEAFEQELVLLAGAFDLDLEVICDFLGAGGMIDMAVGTVGQG